MECYYCEGELKWSHDYVIEDYEGNISGVSTLLECTQCGATWQGFTNPNEEVE